MRVPGARRSTAPPLSCLIVPSTAALESPRAVGFVSDACDVLESDIGNAANKASVNTLLFMFEIERPKAPGVQSQSTETSRAAFHTFSPGALTVTPSDPRGSQREGRAVRAFKASSARMPSSSDSSRRSMAMCSKRARASCGSSFASKEAASASLLSKR